jgi:hypothetical protein
LSICLVVETIAQKVPKIAECTLKSVRNRLLLAFVECCAFGFGVLKGPVPDILMRCTALRESDAYEGRYTDRVSVRFLAVVDVVRGEADDA